MLQIDDDFNFDRIYELYLKLFAEVVVYIKNFALYISIWVIAYLLVCGFVYRKYARRLPTRTRGSLKARRVLVVVAHPDDECMFFGPTIYRLCEQDADVHILCLSNGLYIILFNYYIYCTLKNIKKPYCALIYEVLFLKLKKCFIT